MIKTPVGILVFLSIVGAAPDRASLATRVAGGDQPFNLIEVEGRFLISTNNGYDTNYLLAYDEVERRVASKLELPSLWFGLAYDPNEKLLIASDGRSGVYAVPFDGGTFGKPRLVDVGGCKLTAGLLIQDHTTAIVACNQNHEVLRFDLQSGEVRARLRVGEFPFAIQPLPGNRIAVSNWGQSSVTVIDASSLSKVAEIKTGSHPNQMLVISEAKVLAVSCSDSD